MNNLKFAKMKRFFIYLLVLSYIGTFSQSMYAQDWKNLKDKAKKTVKDNKTTTNPGNNTNNAGSGTVVKDTEKQQGQADEELKKWFEKKSSVMFDSKYKLSITSLERGEFDIEKQIEGAKLLDYPNMLKTLEEKKAAVAASIPGYKVNDAKDYGAKFTNVFINELKPAINSRIEESFKNNGKYDKIASNKMIEAYGLMEVAYLIIPENTDVLALKKDVDMAYDKILKPYYAKVYTSDFHKQNIGKILFSDKPIVIGKENPAQFKAAFGPNDKIYAVAYLNYRYIDHKNGGNTAAYKVSIDGNNAGFISFTHNTGDELLSYYLMEIVPDPSTAYHSLDPQEFGKILSGLSPRKHTLEIGYGGEYNQTLAVGSADLNYEGFDGAAIKANNELAAKNAQSNWIKNIKLPEEFKGAGHKFKDPALSNENMKKICLSSISNIQQIYKIVVLGDGTAEDYHLFKNNLDIPTHMQTKPKVIICYKLKDGSCYYNDIEFRKDYIGGGKYGNPELLEGYKVKIACENIKF